MSREIRGLLQLPVAKRIGSQAWSRDARRPCQKGAEDSASLFKIINQVGLLETPDFLVKVTTLTWASGRVTQNR